jgi:hypothetical protein
LLLLAAPAEVGEPVRARTCDHTRHDLGQTARDQATECRAEGDRRERLSDSLGDSVSTPDDLGVVRAGCGRTFCVWSGVFAYVEGDLYTVDREAALLHEVLA